MKTISFIPFMFLFLNLLSPLNGYGQSETVANLCRDSFSLSEQVEVYEKPVKLSASAGMVLTSGDSPVPNAVIAISKSETDRVTWSEKTDGGGQVIFPTLKSGRYILHICKPGFNVVRFVIDIPKRYPKRLEKRRNVIFRLSPG